MLLLLLLVDGVRPSGERRRDKAMCSPAKDGG